MNECPFCGEEPTALGYNGQPAVSWNVVCRTCGAKGPCVEGNAQQAANKAIELWDHREARRGYMKKIISLFLRDYDGDHLVRDEVTPGAEWVTAGEGVATRKYDGTCCMIHHGQLFKRYESKKPPPDDFMPAQDKDPVTGHWVGWRPCKRADPSDKYHWEAFDAGSDWTDGTYELLGPKVQGNPEGLSKHTLLKHSDAEVLPDSPRDYSGIKGWFEGKDIEGVVFHHSDGRMVKVKLKDFGLKRAE